MGRSLFRAVVGLLALLAFLPIADWIPGGPANSSPFPFLGLAFSWGVWILVALGVGGIVERVLSAIGIRGGWQNEPQGTGSQREVGLSLVLILVPLILYSITSWEVFGGRPVHQDSLTQTFQAQVFSSGHLSVPTSPEPEFFSSLLIAEYDGQSFSQFPPGWAAILAMGMLLGIPWLMAPLFGALSVLGLFLFLRETGQNRAIAIGTTAVFALSPWIVFNSASWMNHVPVLSFLLMASFALVRSVRKPASRLSPVSAGLLFGLATTIRPLDALAFGLPATVWLLARAWRDRELRGTLGWFLMGGAVPAVLLMAYNQILHGSPTTFGYEILWGEAHGLGFHDAPWGPPHTAGRGLQLISRYLHYLQAVLFELPVPALAPAFLALLLVRRLEAVDRYLLAGGGLLLVGYFLYWHDGDFLGPRFLLPLAPLAAIWTVRLGPILVEWGKPERTGRWVQATVAVMVVAGWVIGVPRAWQGYQGMFPSRDLDVSSISALDGREALVLVPTTWESQVATRLWATGLPREEAQWFFDRIPLCRLDVAISELERKTAATNSEVREHLRPLTGDSLSLLAERFSGLPLQPFLGFGGGGPPVPPQCERRDAAQRETLSLPLLQLLAVFGPTWTGSGPVVGQDMHELNPRLFALFPEKQWFSARAMAGGSGGLRLSVFPLDADSAQTQWNLLKGMVPTDSISPDPDSGG